MVRFLRGKTILLLLLLVSLSVAQDLDQTNHWKQVISEVNSDTAVVNAYIYLGFNYYLSDPDTALLLWNTSLEICDRGIDNYKDFQTRDTLRQHKADLLNNIGYIYYLRGDNEKVLDYYLKSLAIREKFEKKKTLLNPSIILEAYIIIPPILRKPLNIIIKALTYTKI